MFLPNRAGITTSLFQNEPMNFAIFFGLNEDRQVNVENGIMPLLLREDKLREREPSEFKGTY